MVTSGRVVIVVTVALDVVGVGQGTSGLGPAFGVEGLAALGVAHAVAQLAGPADDALEAVVARGGGGGGVM